MVATSYLRRQPGVGGSDQQHGAGAEALVPAADLAAVRAGHRQRRPQHPALLRPLPQRALPRPGA